MSYYVIIGTSDNVKPMVDEIRKSHQPQHFVTTGCICSDQDNLIYNWTVYGKQGAESDNRQTTLENALTNQIAAFYAILPDKGQANILIIARYWKDEDLENLKRVCNAFNKVSKNFQRAISIDIALLGFDLENPNDVTNRPDWHFCKEAYKYFQGFTNLTCNICYINNLNSNRAKVELDKSLIARVLLNWTMGKQHFNIANNRYYSIGMAEYRYDITQIEDFFRLAAKEYLLNRKVSASPASIVKEQLDRNERFDFDLPWIDGLGSIISEWEPYCATEYDFSQKAEDNPYCLAAQEAEIAEPLLEILHLYARLLKEDIENLNSEKNTIESELTSKDEEDTTEDNSEDLKKRLEEINKEITDKTKELEPIKNFPSAQSICNFIQNNPTLTKKKEEDLQSRKENHARMIKYLSTDKAIEQMEAALKEKPDFVPSKQPSENTLENIGFKKEQYLVSHNDPTPIAPSLIPEPIQQEKKRGCLPKWIASLFNLNNESESELEIAEGTPTPSPSLEDDVTKKMKEWVGKLREVNEVRSWWNKLNDHTQDIKNRWEECHLKMDGDKEHSGYTLNTNPNSMPLINMERVRTFRDSDKWFKGLLNKLENEYFDSNIPIDKRKSEQEMIENHIISQIKNIYSDLKWDGTNPFVDEQMSDEKFGELVNDMIKHSALFIEQNQEPANLQCNFLYDKPGIPTQSPQFCNKYQIGGNSNIIPQHDVNFKNTLCVMHFASFGDVPSHILDFCPKPKHYLHNCTTDFTDISAQITLNNNDDINKAKAIFDWLCDNISYDVSKQIHDADTCFRHHTGVCQAYCELFVHIADKAGLISQIVCGSIKDNNNNIPEEKHAWIFVYTDNYDGIFIDPTWGAGSVSGGEFHKNPNRDEWFDVKPYALIYTHFPDKMADSTEWTKLQLKDLTMEKFKNLPYRNLIEVKSINTLISDLSNLEE